MHTNQRAILSVAVAGMIAVACSGSSTQGPGTLSDGGGPPSAEAGEPPLSSAALASPYLAKCTVACALPADGPCSTADRVGCIEKCTALVDGLKVGCVQCLIEGSGWSGVTCPATCTCCPCAAAFGPAPRKPCAGSEDGTTPCSCDPSAEKCTEFTMPKSTSTCASACQ
jgi:hypothetical protein